MRKKNRKLRRLGLLLPRKRERSRAELLAAAGAGLLVVSIFLISSIDRFILRSDQYAAVIAAVLVDLANGDRLHASVPSLKMNPVLIAAAQAKANDMAAKSYFAHVSPEGVDPWHWFKEVGYSFDYAGENLAVDFSDSSDVNQAWMNSPTHRENILDPHFTEIGIATAQGVYQGRATTFVVQEFGLPAEALAQAGAPARASLAVAHETIPENPTKPALARSAVGGASAKGSAVLGEATQSSSEPSPAATKKTLASPASTSIGAIVRSPDYAPWWAHLIASPKQMMHSAYFVLAFIIMLALMFATGLELRWHHRGKAAAAGAVLALICILFVLGDNVVFPHPTLTAKATMTAAAGASF